jgi:hypothetical protein
VIKNLVNFMEKVRMLEVNSNLRCYGNTYLEITLHFGHWYFCAFPERGNPEPLRGDSSVSNMIDARKAVVAEGLRLKRFVPLIRP